MEFLLKKNKDIIFKRLKNKIKNLNIKIENLEKNKNKIELANINLNKEVEMYEKSFNNLKKILMRNKDLKNII